MNTRFTKYALAASVLMTGLSGCRNYLNVQPQGEVIPTTDEEFASIIHNRLRDIEGGGDEYVIGNMDALKHLEGCADDLDANIKSRPTKTVGRLFATATSSSRTSQERTAMLPRERFRRPIQ